MASNHAMIVGRIAWFCRLAACIIRTGRRYELDVSDLKLAANEYITDFKLEFGTVEPGFHELDAPFIITRVMDDLPHEYRFVNKTDVGS